LQKLKPPRPTRVAVRKPGRNSFDREEVTRTTGGSVGRVDVYYYGPDGKRLRSRKEVKDYCTANGLTYEILDFDFSSNRPVTSTLLDDPVDVGIEDEDDNSFHTGTFLVCLAAFAHPFAASHVRDSPVSDAVIITRDRRTFRPHARDQMRHRIRRSPSKFRKLRKVIFMRFGCTTGLCAS
uniref:MBD domain-containing protein n=1 Tax=Strigamia maritima TaxID=126957 RepID=T1IYB0_STRMM